MSQLAGKPPGLGPSPPYLRAVDPLPLQSAEFNQLHGFYERLAAGALCTTRCAGCGRVDWPPRGFCPACLSARYDWVDLPREGRLRGFTIQETGVPVGFPRPLVLAVVEVAGLRVFAPLVGVTAPAALAVGAAVRFVAVRVADDPRGSARYLAAFTPVVTPAEPPA